MTAGGGDDGGDGRELRAGARRRRPAGKSAPGGGCGAGGVGGGAGGRCANAGDARLARGEGHPTAPSGEVGVFTGGSVLATALAIPDDGKIIAIDVSREYFDLGRPVIEKAGVAHKINFREGPVLSILDNLLADEGNEGKFDFAFVDADKKNYGGYHEQLLRLVRVGGVLAYDNTLWGGSVALPDDVPLTKGAREIRAAIRAFNAKIAADARVEAVQIPVADGITLCRRVV
ncbi:unnamed protein product [Urochloa humidicola]